MELELKEKIRKKAYQKLKEKMHHHIGIIEEKTREIENSNLWKYEYSCIFEGFGKSGVATVYFDSNLEVKYISVLYVDMDIWIEAESISVPIVMHTTMDVAYFNEDILKEWLKRIFFSFNISNLV